MAGEASEPARARPVENLLHVRTLHLAAALAPAAAAPRGSRVPQDAGGQGQGSGAAGETHAELSDGLQAPARVGCMVRRAGATQRRGRGYGDRAYRARRRSNPRWTSPAR